MIVDVVRECVGQLDEYFPFVVGNGFLANIEADNYPLAFSFLDEKIPVRHERLPTGRINTFYRLFIALAIKTEFSESTSNEQLQPARVKKAVMEELFYHQKKLFQKLAEHPDVDGSSVKQGTGTMDFNKYDANFDLIPLVVELSLKNDGFSYCPPPDQVRRRIFDFTFPPMFE